MRCGFSTPSIVRPPPVTAARPMKRRHLDVVGADPPLASAQRLDALDAEDVRLDPLDVRAERDEEAAEILDVRLARGVADHRLARERARRP